LETIERWFALYVKPRHEKTISHLLTAAGLTSFLPLYVRQHVYGNRTKQHELPFFPGYVFCRFGAAQRTKVLSTAGVFFVVSIGKTPAPIDDAEILSLQTAIKADLELNPCSFPQTGQRVRITKGVLKGVEGVIVDTKKPTRLVLTITLLQRSLQIDVDQSWVSECDASYRMSMLPLAA
jgi:transcription antitermination factor NusG